MPSSMTMMGRAVDEKQTQEFCSWLEQVGRSSALSSYPDPVL